MNGLEAFWQPAVQQRIFRTLVDAFARPGTVGEVASACGEAPALYGVLATLVDGSTTLADVDGLLSAADWSLLQASRVAPDMARFVIAEGDRLPRFTPALGTLDSPEEGATLLVRVTKIGAGETALMLTGPGIAGRARLAVTGLHDSWLTARAHWVAAFPRGVDLLFVDERCVAALPRTTRIEALAEAAA